ncbi:hypothetical protein Tco_0928293 [Tanacetum coccineum]
MMVSLTIPWLTDDVKLPSSTGTLVNIEGRFKKRWRVDPRFRIRDSLSQKDYKTEKSDIDDHSSNVLLNKEPTKSDKPDQHVDTVELNSIDHLQKKDTSEKQQDIDSSPSKPPGSKGSFSNNSAHSFVAASYTSRKFKSKNLRPSVSLIDSLVTHIELGSLMRYDMEGSKIDSKNYIDSLGTSLGHQ